MRDRGIGPLPDATTPFANFDVDEFLRDYWQKRPFLIRNPWGNWVNPIEPDELAGLACEPHIESRLVMQAAEPKRDWKLEPGPFPEDRFGTLGADPCTLLVQAVDHHIPEVAALVEPFRFLPNWRIDDVMVSYATDQGGVGAHFDQYDVFLVQGLGRRRWQIGALCDDQTELLPHEELRLLARFEPLEEWVLEPGDILYVPPRIAHNGVAVGNDCMTYSIGFRAPAQRELIMDWAESLLDAESDGIRYEDPDYARQANPGEITGQAIDRLHALMCDKLQDRDAFARWFGQYNSRSKYPEIEWGPEEPPLLEDVRLSLARGNTILRNPASRLSFIRQDDAKVLLFADGECFECTGESAALAEHLCAQARVSPDPGLADAEGAASLIATLINQGSLAFDQDE